MSKMIEYAERQLTYNSLPSIRKALQVIGITALIDEDIIDFIDGRPIDYNGYIITNKTKLEDLNL